METIKIYTLRDLTKYLNDNKIKKKDIVYLNRENDAYVLIIEKNDKQK